MTACADEEAQINIAMSLDGFVAGPNQSDLGEGAVVDLTIVNVALLTIGRDRRRSFGDQLGRMRVFLAGIAFFGAASLAAASPRTPASSSRPGSCGVPPPQR